MGSDYWPCQALSPCSVIPLARIPVVQTWNWRPRLSSQCPHFTHGDTDPGERREKPLAHHFFINSLTAHLDTALPVLGMPRGQTQALPQGPSGTKLWVKPVAGPRPPVSPSRAVPMPHLTGLPTASSRTSLFCYQCLSFILHSFIPHYLLGICYLPVNILGTQNTAMQKTAPSSVGESDNIQNTQPTV